MGPGRIAVYNVGLSLPSCITLFVRMAGLFLHVLILVRFTLLYDTVVLASGCLAWLVLPFVSPPDRRTIHGIILCMSRAQHEQE